MNFKEKRDLVIQAGMQLVPYVGGSLSTMYFGAKQERRFARIESFYSELAEELKHLKGMIPNIEEHESIALESIIEILHEKIELEPTIEKRRFFKNYFKNTLKNPVKNNYDQRKVFLETLAEMSLLECELLTFIRSNSRVLVGDIQKEGVDQYAIVGGIGKLKNRGFITTGQQTVFAGGSTDNSLYEIVSISNYGNSFFSFCIND